MNSLASTAARAVVAMAALGVPATAQESDDSPLDLTFGTGTATSVEFYGYLKFDFITDFGGPLGNTTFGLVGLDTDTDDATFSATANQTRIGLRTTTPSDFGDLETQLELDFYGDGASFGTGQAYQPRVRHATATLGGFRVGKYWTTFMPLGSYPLTLDFQGVAGIPFARQEQLRYTYEAGSFVAEAALEDSNNADSGTPVYIGAVAYDTDPLLLRASALYGKAADGAGNEDDAWGVNLSTTVQLGEGTTIDAAYTVGEGIASYLVFLGDDLDAAGDAIGQQAAYLGVSQSLGEKLTVRGIVGDRENDTGAAAATESLTSVHLNAEYALLENTSVGAEYFHGERDTFGGDNYSVDRIQASVQIDF